LSCLDRSARPPGPLVQFHHRLYLWLLTSTSLRQLSFPSWLLNSTSCAHAMGSHEHRAAARYALRSTLTKTMLFSGVKSYSTPAYLECPFSLESSSAAYVHSSHTAPDPARTKILTCLSLSLTSALNPCSTTSSSPILLVIICSTLAIRPDDMAANTSWKSPFW
jgi:hypothetical protein